MNEDLEMKRAEVTKLTLDALVAIVTDTKGEFQRRMESAMLVRAMCQDIMLSDLTSRGMTEESSKLRTILNHADKLDRNKE